MLNTVLLTFMGGVVCAHALVSGERRTLQFEHFDDYLLVIGNPRDSEFNEVAKTSTDGEDGRVPSDEASESTSSNSTKVDITNGDFLGYFRDVPRRHWSCCMLGKLAGDKGFHCHAQFYAARITRRNYNRAHNRRMPLMHGPHRIANWGAEIMSTFQRCIARHSAEFHKCCYAGGIERRERLRWHDYRSAVAHPDRMPLRNQRRSDGE